jgi:ligand-binding sensor domain-containing protein/serine phosphatase RsbU (regulator of sigma subunit)
MRLRTNIVKLTGTLVCLFLFPILANSQIYSFRPYGVENNIPNGFVYTINQSDDGYLWVGTSNGLCRFDGFDFFPVNYPDSAVGRYPTSTIKDKSGKLWFGCSDGTVFYTEGGKLVSLPLENTKIIKELIEGTNGLIYIIPQEKSIFSVNPLEPENVIKYSFADDPVLFSASFTSSGNLLVGTQQNILICRLENNLINVVDTIEGFNDYAVTYIHQTDDETRFILGTDGNGLFQLQMSNSGNMLTRFRDHPEWNDLNVQSVTEDSDKNLWISTLGNGAIQFNLSDNFETVKWIRNYNSQSGLEGNDVKSVFQDIQGNYWIGFFGEGISMLTSYALGYYTPGKNQLENNILFINSLNGKYILGTPSGYHQFDPVDGKSTSFTDLAKQIGKADISTYHLDKDNNLWIGTSGDGLFVRNSKGSVKLFYRSGDSGSDNILDIETDEINIWLATANGVIVVDRKSGKDKHIFDIDNGLPHNYINKILLNTSGDAYVGTKSDKLYKIDKNFNISSSSSSMNGSVINEILSLSQNRNNDIWIATKGNGVFRFLNDSVSAINRSNDLMNNYCYSILADSENDVWIGHQKGFSRYNPATGIIRIFGTDFAKGGVCNPEGLYESSDKKIFIGTTDGLIVLDKVKDNKTEIAPFTNITSITINDVEYNYQPSFSLPYKKKYVIKVHYTGINFRAPDKVFYSTFLENYDSDWSKVSTSKDVSYNLSFGKYKFNLISVNEDGLSQEGSETFTISIKRPIWRTWWFILSSIVIFISIAVLIIRERDKAQKKIQEYLEKELEARTSVVMKQKGEIELQNIEITDSINYAKRIQTSILPDISKLKESFKDAFILFQPRDIVSGDFYWFDKLEDDRFILVCADSTGHGVPGAFMSMIGSTLLQDIVTRKRVSKPSEILNLLDKQIFSTLNQNVEYGVSNDGMDMVVIELNVKTRHIKFASAMRPVIVVMDGESYYLKGNRSSIGGESVMEKFFDDQEYYLNEGDTIYLFSDGLSDQFGGTDGKKMKIARLKRLIEQVSKLPMDQQKEAISKFFFDWKGTYDQVDDILLIGVKV